MEQNKKDLIYLILAVIEVREEMIQNEGIEPHLCSYDYIEKRIINRKNFMQGE